MKQISDQDYDIVRALVNQVAAAARSCGVSEVGVRTYITRPMWKAWLRALDMPEESEPGCWHSGFRVYGSETIVVESDAFESISFAV